MTRPILVTGPQGFAGSNLLAQLGEQGLPTDVDVTDAPALAETVRSSSPGAIVHLAAVSSVTASAEDPGAAWRVNVVGAVNLLEAARADAPGARILMVSTGEVYGRADQVPTPEDAPLAPISQYAASKAAAEIACGLASRSGLDVVVARAFQHEGPGRDERFAVGSWTAQIARAEEAGGGSVLVGDLSSQRDITDVRDVCRAYELLLDPAVPAQTYNVASGRVVELRDVLDLLVGMARCPIQVEPDPGRSRRSDLTVISGDPSRLHAATGWAPTIPLEQTLADTLDFARHTAAERMAST
ncbi:MAG TPA: GDP-mannose 4,6-dehydratase [Gaiellaceae bacterium]|nr:GDP-mannose 4,6-dehydratase [Gaiellaceae bacterium]